jgi:hypothetical protein
VQHFLALAGLAFGVTGSFILALADIWFSHAVLVYIDAVETDLFKAIEVLRQGGNQFVTAGVNLKRDRNQDRARFTKLLGWTVLVLGFLCQMAVLLLPRILAAY